MCRIKNSLKSHKSSVSVIHKANYHAWKQPCFNICFIFFLHKKNYWISIIKFFFVYMKIYCIKKMIFFVLIGVSTFKIFFNFQIKHFHCFTIKNIYLLKKVNKNSLKSMLFPKKLLLKNIDFLFVLKTN